MTDNYIQKLTKVPPLSDETIKDILWKNFGLSLQHFKVLNGYEDRNYLVKIESEKWENANIAKLWPHGYVLKITNVEVSANASLLDGQNQLLLWAHQKGFPCQQPTKTKTGELQCLLYLDYDTSKLKSPTIDNANTGGYHMARLFTFIPGQIIATVSYTPALLFNVGKFLAELTISLKYFHHPAFDNYTHIWCLKRAPDSLQFEENLQNDTPKQNLVREVLTAFKRDVLPTIVNFNQGQVHGDFNEQNILVSEKEDNTFEVCGILDFGDTHQSYYVFDIALAITYMMLDAKSIGILDVGGHVLAGYLSVTSLTEAELQVLPVCVAARFAQSLLLGLQAYSESPEPENDYVLVTQKKGWDVLTQFWSFDKTDILKKWRDIANSR